MTRDAVRRSDYLEWVKRRRGIKYSLSMSGVPRMPLQDLGASLDFLLTSEPNLDGWPPLLDVIASRAGLSSNHVSLATAASGAMHLAFGVMLDPGDHVAMETPVYEPLVKLAQYFSCHIDYFERHESNQWRTDPDDVKRALTPKTRLVVLSNLHNPSGGWDGDDTLRRIAVHADGAGARVLVDEVYLEFLHAGGVRPAARLAPNIISASSVTKTYGLDALRLGWVLAEPALAEKARRLNDLYSNNTAHPSERLAYLALQRGDELLRPINATLAQHIELADAFVQSQPMLSWVRPRAGTCGMVRVDGMNVDELEQMLARDYATGIVPGRFFSAPSHFRLAWGVDTETFRTGLEHLGTALGRSG